MCSPSQKKKKGRPKKEGGPVSDAERQSKRRKKLKEQQDAEQAAKRAVSRASSSKYRLKKRSNMMIASKTDKSESPPRPVDSPPPEARPRRAYFESPRHNVEEPHPTGLTRRERTLMLERSVARTTASNNSAMDKIADGVEKIADGLAKTEAARASTEENEMSLQDLLGDGLGSWDQSLFSQSHSSPYRRPNLAPYLGTPIHQVIHEAAEPVSDLTVMADGKPVASLKSPAPRRPVMMTRSRSSKKTRSAKK